VTNDNVVEQAQHIPGLSAPSGFAKRCLHKVPLQRQPVMQTVVINSSRYYSVPCSPEVGLPLIPCSVLLLLLLLVQQLLAHGC
jgi:hypothetical protein